MIKFLKLSLLIVGVPLFLIIGLIISISIYSIPLYIILLIIKVIFSIDFKLSWEMYYTSGIILLLIHKILIKKDKEKTFKYESFKQKISQNLDNIYKHMNIIKA